VPDPAAARAFFDLEATDQLARLLRVVPAQQRTALTLAYLEGRSHEEIGHALGVSPRAAEGLVYRGLRRLQTVAAQCMDEPEALTVWCPHCGHHRLVAQLLPGVGPDGPLWRRWRCPGCALASHWTVHNVVPLARYPSIEAAWWHERVQWGKGWPQGLARASGLRCWKCGAPVLRRDRPPDTARQGEPPLYVLHWSCFKCDVGTYWGFLSVVATGFLPEWLAFWRSAPHLLFEPERLVRAGGEEQVVLTARDPDTGRRATLAVARDTLEVRRFEVEER
jgi:DNA-directed RNA polymerase subunit RPC12/RpoP